MASHAAAGPVAGWCFDDRGRPKALEPGEEPPAGGLVWLSFAHGNGAAFRWMRERGIADVEAPGNLFEDDPRPALALRNGGVLLSMRAAAVDAGQPKTLLSPLLLFARGDLVVTIRSSPIPALEELEREPTCETPAAGAGAVIALILERAVDGLDALADGLTDRMDLLEEQLIEIDGEYPVAELGNLRRMALQIHRRLTPQREVLQRFAHDAPEWMADDARVRLHEVAAEGVRILDEVQAVRDHTALLQDELDARQNERLNRRLYLFTVIASVFLPLTFLTGLLGANVAGIPFAEERWAFAALIGLVVTIAVGQYLVLRWTRLL